MSKKFLSLALALVMCLGLTVPAFAEGEPGSTTIQDSGGFSYTLSKPVVGTHVNESGDTVYQITEGTIITPVLPEGTVKKIVDEDHERLFYSLPNDESAVYFHVGEVYLTPYGIDIASYGELEGQIFSQTHHMNTPTQPIPKGEGYAITRGSTIINGLGGEGEATYIFLDVVLDDGSTQPTQPTVPTVGGFTDVKTGDYFAEPVKWAVEKNITAGTSATTFSPDQNCTVAQILTFLWRANGSPKPTKSNPFTDVKNGDYYADAAAWAYEKGMVSGSTFGGNTPCTRSMAVTYMWKAAGSPSAEAANFTDVPANADYAQAVAWAVEQGVTAGTSATTFSPDSICTRGQIVTFLYRGLAK